MDKYLYFWLKIRGEYSPFDIADEKYSYEDIFTMGEKDLISKIGLDEKNAKYLVRRKMEYSIDEEYEKFLRSGVRVFEYGEEGFPARLMDIPDPPRAIFSLGKKPRDDVRSVAIIGARKCSEYGRFMAEKLAKGLSKEGIQIISGMALGIDGLAQMATLEAKGDSYGVLGSGVDICYPRSNYALYERLKREGGLISEYANETAAVNSHFPRRNRIISGLADGLIVVEAKQKSGTIITVDAALSQGKDIFVVPGRATDALSVGCNGLIKQGAYPVQCAEDVIEVLKGNEGSYFESLVEDDIYEDDLYEYRNESHYDEKRERKKPVIHSTSNLNKGYKKVLKQDEKNLKKIMPEIPDLSREENMVYLALGFNPVSPAMLLDSVDLEFVEIACILVELEMKGLIKEIGRNQYVRNVV